MTDVVWVGFGDLGCPRVPQDGMEYVAIPTGTKIAVFTPECVPYGEGWNHWDEWSAMGDCADVLSDTEPAPNILELHGGEAFGHPDFHRAFDGALVAAPGHGGLPDPLPLCSGTPQDCPTTPQDVRRGRAHACDGILGHLTRSGFTGTAYLVLTTRVRHTGPDEEEPPQTREEAAACIRADADIQAATALENGNMLAEFRREPSLRYVLGGGMFLIDRQRDLRNHDPDFAGWAREDPGRVTGELLIDRDARGTIRLIRVHGVRDPRDQDFVRAALRRLAPCEVTFEEPGPRRDPTPAGEPASAHAHEVNRALLAHSGTGTSGTADKLHYMLGNELLLLSPQRGPDNHRKPNRRYVGAGRPVTGTLLVTDRRITVVPDTAAAPAERTRIAEQIRDPHHREVVFATGGPRRPVADDSAYVENAHRATRSRDAPPFLVTEPEISPRHLDEEHAHYANVAALKGAFPASHLADLRERNELHYRIGGGLLLISPDEDFANHKPRNRHYVRSHGTEGASTGALFLYRAAPGAASGRRIDAVPDAELSDTGKHFLRAAIDRLFAAEVTFYS
ncbi:hypothetical protein [Streptomyces sp. NPDC001594]|uniref:hypothetical protein n=1 Tax=Streptomyces sp. NPDC001594 TaxID=3364590 RepID=UPI00369B2DC5